jgi:signal transduction histidine kinase
MVITALFSPNKIHQGRILIVEDDPASRELLRVMLEHSHYVETAHNGEAALKIIQEHEFDLVLLDIMMPGINGIEVLKTVRKEKNQEDLPIILVSALTDEMDIVKGLEMGANDYIRKPIEPAVLLARVRTQLQLKRLYDTHKHHIEELERAEKLRTQFMQIASHDLKNPLHNLHIASSLLQDEIGDDERVAQILNVLDLTVENMHHVIEDFLDVVAIQSDAVGLKPVELSVRDIVNNVAVQYEIAAEEKDIRLDIHPIDGHIVADQARMIQILSNLVSNAIKYSPVGATVTLWAENSGLTMRLCVQDEGPGIPKNERSQLFTEFGKLSTTPTANEPRTGLGLWIVKHLMQMQGGTVGASFPDEGGSIFWLEFPTIIQSEEEILISETA